MLLRHRPPGLDATPVTLQPGLEHLDQGWVAVLRWLNANRVDHVLVGPAAHAIRGELTARGPAAIVPAPYTRNYERLARALVSQNAALRAERETGAPARAATVAVEITAEKLMRGRRWALRFGGQELDVENVTALDGHSFQELLYEAGRFELAPGLSVEVAAAADLAAFSGERSGEPAGADASEFKVSRGSEVRTPADS